MSFMDYTNLSTQLIIAVIQVIVWSKLFNFGKNYCKQHFSSHSWYKQAISKGDGEVEFLCMLCAIPQHTVSAIFIGFGILFESPLLFSIGTTGEFAFELIELFDICTKRFIYNNCQFKDDMVAAMIFHHLPGVLVIIPVNMFYGNDIYVQKVAFNLLVIAPLVILFCIGYKTRNIYDIQQRGQFTVYMFCTVAALIWNRFYCAPYCMFEVIYYRYNEMCIPTRFMFIFYGVGITLFNIAFVWILSQRLYTFMFHEKYSAKAAQQKVAYPPSNYPVLSRARSNPVIFHDKRN